MNRNMSDDAATGILAGVLLVVVVPAIVVVSALWSSLWAALAAWQLWQWFAIPLGAPDINGYHIAGLLVLAHFGLSNAKDDDEKKMERTQKIVLLIVRSPLQSLGLVIVGFILAKLAGLI